MAITIVPVPNNWSVGIQVLTGTTLGFIATVVNDPANGGVNWALTCDKSPCGTVSASTTASGKQVTYTAPPLANFDVTSVTVTATAVSNSTITSSVPFEIYGRRVDAQAASATIGAGSSTQITASAFADPANENVTWALQCAAADCGSLSASGSASGVPVTYTAPAGPVETDLSVTVTVTSVSHPDVQTSVAVLVAAVVVSMTPDSALVPLKDWSFFTGNLQWAPKDGINWSITQSGAACGSACGSFEPAASLSGQEVTYTAPSVMPASATVSLVATSVFDRTKTASATVQLTTGTVELVPNSLHVGRHKYVYEAKRKCNDGPETARLTNTGASPLTISGITIGGADPQAFSQTNTCVSPLAAGGACDISVKFSCSSAVGDSASALIAIADNSPDSPQQLMLTGYTSGSWPTATAREALSMQSAVSTPVPTGSRLVGTRLLSLADTHYADPYLANGTARELMVRLWYPAAATKGCVRADYASRQVWDYFASLLGVALPQVSTHSCQDALVDAGTHPVVVLTHGFTGTFTDYTFLAEDLASRGYVVASVNHTFEATETELADGRLEKSIYGSHLNRYTRYDADALAQALAVRLQDLRFVLDQLGALNRAPSGPFAGRLDLERVALAGHSLGGLTTLRALAADPRFKAGVVLDGALSPQPLPSVRQPVLTVVAGLEPEDPDECRMWNALRGPRVAVALPGVEHIALSDAVWLVGTAIRTGSAGSDRVVSTVRRNIASFLDATFNGYNAEQAVVAARMSFPGARVATGAQLSCRAQ